MINGIYNSTRSGASSQYTEDYVRHRSIHVPRRWNFIPDITITLCTRPSVPATTTDDGYASYPLFSRTWSPNLAVQEKWVPRGLREVKRGRPDLNGIHIS